MQNYNGNLLNGAMNIPTSPVTFIKNEPLATPPDHRRFSQHGFPDAYTMSGNGAYHHQPSHFGGQNYESIDPSSLTMSPVSNDHEGSMPRNIPIPQNAGYAQSYGPNYNATQSLNFLTNEELIELGDEPQLGTYDMHLMSNAVLANGTLDSGYSQTPDNITTYQFRPVQPYETPSSYSSQISR